jgi:hypothetical protein
VCVMGMWQGSRGERVELLTNIGKESGDPFGPDLAVLMQDELGEGLSFGLANELLLASAFTVFQVGVCELQQERVHVRR